MMKKAFATTWKNYRLGHDAQQQHRLRALPVQYVDRARPEFSLCTHWGELEVGLYGAVSPYRAWGLMMGIQF
jgi:hypothetical protein